MTRDAGETDAAASVNAPVTAATVVLMRDGTDGVEVLLLERPRDRGSFAGAWVFPGGRVDPEDRVALPAAGQADLGETDAEEASVRRAAIREVREETALELTTDALVPTARWTPPESAPRRFHTWFYWSRAPKGGVVLSPNEAVDFAWIRPSVALDTHGSGLLRLVPPTWVTLHELSKHATVHDALQAARHGTVQNYVTRLGANSRGDVLLWQEDIAYADDALFEADGPRNRLEIGDLPWVYNRS